MLTVDGLSETFRLYLLSDTTMVGLMPGGWLYDRQRQATTEAAGKTGYGVIRIDYSTTVNSTSFIYRKYTVTLAGYLTANSQDQSTFQQRLSTLIDFHPELLQPFVPGTPSSGINMVTPAEVSQKVASEMKQGSDVVPVMAAWSVTVVDQRS